MARPAGRPDRGARTPASGHLREPSACRWSGGEPDDERPRRRPRDRAPVRAAFQRQRLRELPPSSLAQSALIGEAGDWSLPRFRVDSFGETEYRPEEGFMALLLPDRPWESRSGSSGAFEVLPKVTIFRVPQPLIQVALAKSCVFSEHYGTPAHGHGNR